MRGVSCVGVELEYDSSVFVDQVVDLTDVGPQQIYELFSKFWLWMPFEKYSFCFLVVSSSLAAF